jgi:hypothetical protein
MRRAISTLTAAAVLSIASAGQAQTREPVYTQSIFSYGYQGFFLGAGAGLGAGYLSARVNGFNQNDWKDIAYGAGIGALAGGALGLTLGITDMASETPGRGYYILRDGGYGMGFGIVAGGIAGGIAAVSSKDGEKILFGAAIGALVGTAAGVVLGIVEGSRSSRRASVGMTVAAAPSAGGHLVWMPAVVGRY